MNRKRQEPKLAPEASTTYLTPTDIAKELGTSQDLVYDWIRKHDLRAVNLATGNGRPMYRVKREWLNEFLGRRETLPSQEKAQRKPRTKKVIPDLVGFDSD